MVIWRFTSLVFAMPFIISGYLVGAAWASFWSAYQEGYRNNFN